MSLKIIFSNWPLLLLLPGLFLYALPLWSTPALTIDEGYYLGASRAILQGDWFLRTYSFDKPYLVALWPLPGMLLLGNHPIGFRLVPLLCFAAAMVVFFRTAIKVIQSRILSLLFTATLFFLPLVFAHGVSNLCEPYLILFSCLLLYGHYHERSDSFMSRVFFLGVFTKFSFFLYFPLLLPRIRKTGVKEFLRPSVLILVFGLLYFVANPVKFGPLTWFSHFVSDRHPVSFLKRTIGRVIEVSGALGSYSLFAILLFSAGFGLIRLRAPWSDSRWILTLLVLIHFMTYLFMGAVFYQRYVVQVLPALFMVALWGVAQMRGTRIRAGLLQPLFVLIFLPCAVHILKQARSSIDSEVDLGRELQVYGSEVSHEGAWIQNAYLWKSAPYAGKVWNEGCTAAVCRDRIRVAYPLFENGYLFQGGRIVRLPLYVGPVGNVRVEDIFWNRAPEELGTRLLESLRLKNTYRIEVASIEGGDAGDPNAMFVANSYVFQAVPKEGRPSFLPRLTIRAAPGINEFHQPSSFPRPVFSILMRVHEIRLGEWNATDWVMPLFFQGYVRELEILPYPYFKNVRFSIMRPGPKGIVLRRTTVSI